MHTKQTHFIEIYVFQLHNSHLQPYKTQIIDDLQARIFSLRPRQHICLHRYYHRHRSMTGAIPLFKRRDQNFATYSSGLFTLSLMHEN